MTVVKYYIKSFSLQVRLTQNRRDGKTQQLTAQNGKLRHGDFYINASDSLPFEVLLL
jgi:hypothetical protein